MIGFQRCGADAKLDKLSAKDPRIDNRLAGPVESGGIHRVCGIPINATGPSNQLGAGSRSSTFDPRTYSKMSRKVGGCKEKKKTD